MADLQSGLLLTMVPELGRLKGTREVNGWHNNESSWDHTWQVLENARNLLDRQNLSRLRHRLDYTIIGSRSQGELFEWANMLHDIAKPDTQFIYPDGTTLYHGHEPRGSEMAAEIMKRLGFAAEEVAWVRYLVRWHGDMHAFFGLEEVKFQPWFQGWCLAHRARLPELFLHSWADSLYSYEEETNPTLYQRRLKRYENILEDASFHALVA